MAPSHQAYLRSRDRDRARAKEDPSLIPHGTDCGYSYWGCRCVSCRGKNASRMQVWLSRVRGEGATP